jgi:UDP-3-O-[3-hydroxymyristoyl] glucosamine N-acyltransferase
MAEARFFSNHGPFSLAALAEATHCTLKTRTPELLIHDVASLQAAIAGQVAFLSNVKYREHLATTAASACVVSSEHAALAPAHLALLISANPYHTYAQIAALFYPKAVVRMESGTIHSSAVIDATARVAPGVTIGPGVVIEAHAEVDEGTSIHANTVVGSGVVIGKNGYIGANVTLSHCIIGDWVRIHPGVCIGQDGFGFATEKGQHLRVPQLGCVRIGNHVDIGANATIDRGTITDTVIGDGCQLDNLVQIGHNAVLGRGCVMVAMSGVAGSTTLGNYVVVGGQAGFAGHLTIGDGVQVAAQSGVMHDLPAKMVVGGTPAVPIKDWHRQSIVLKRLIHPKSGQGN